MLNFHLNFYKILNHAAPFFFIDIKITIPTDIFLSYNRTAWLERKYFSKPNSNCYGCYFIPRWSQYGMYNTQNWRLVEFIFLFKGHIKFPHQTLFIMSFYVPYYDKIYAGKISCMRQQQEIGKTDTGPSTAELFSLY